MISQLAHFGDILNLQFADIWFFGMVSPIAEPSTNQLNYLFPETMQLLLRCKLFNYCSIY